MPVQITDFETDTGDSGNDPNEPVVYALPNIKINGEALRGSIFVRLTGEERLHELFEYRLVLDLQQYAGTPTDWIGQEISIEILLPLSSGSRFINGRVSRVQQDMNKRATVYAVPGAWQLAQNRVYRIFENASLNDILYRILGESGFSLDARGVTESTRQRRYTVQAGESDWAFVSRLLEEEGIYYYFPPGHEVNDILITDSVSSHSSLNRYGRIPYAQTVNQQSIDESIWGWETDSSWPPRALHSRGYNYLNSGEELYANRLSMQANSLWEIYEYPGPQQTVGEAEMFVRRRMEETKWGCEVITGFTSARGLYTGALFTLENAPRGDQEREYLVIALYLDLSVEGHKGTLFEDVQNPTMRPLVYMAQFQAIPSDVPFRPIRRTPRPRMPGPQTATVVDRQDPQGMGGVKVRFHWAGDDDSTNKTCAIRIAQPLAGKAHGFQFTPQPGDEVVVSFEDGDPDRPIITGCVYNDRHGPPLGSVDKESIISTRSGNKVQFSDDDGMEKIVVSSPCSVRIKGERELKLETGDGRAILLPDGATEIKVQSTAKVHIEAGQIELTAGVIKLSSAIVKTDGMIKCGVLLADSVIASSYTPGAGNIW